MTFAHPIFLLLLLLLPVLAWLKGRAGQGAAFLYSSTDIVRPVAGLNRSRAGRILSVLRWLSLALFIVALAQPRHIKGESRVKASGIDIAAVIDLSSSMLSEDFEVGGERISRIDIAKKVLGDFIEHRPDDRMGADEGAVVALRALVRQPFRDLDCDAALLPRRGPQREGAILAAVESADGQGVAFLPGEHCFAEMDPPKGWARLNFSNAAPEVADRALAVLAEVVGDAV